METASLILSIVQKNFNFRIWHIWINKPRPTAHYLGSKQYDNRAR